MPANSDHRERCQLGMEFGGSGERHCASVPGRQAGRRQPRADLFAAGFACGSVPGGDNWAGGPHPELRAYTTPGGQAATREGGINLAPETSNNYSIGIELAPQIDFLRGLDLQATWYSVKVNGTLLGFNNVGSSNVGNPAERFHFITPSDLGCPVAQNATPAACAPFETMVRAAVLDRNSQLDSCRCPECLLA